MSQCLFTWCFKRAVTNSCSRWFSSSCLVAHDNPLGLPRKSPLASDTSGPAPTIPRRGSLPAKRPITHVKYVVAVASGKGGVGKSTIAVNLAYHLTMLRDPLASSETAYQPSSQLGLSRRLRVGILDLDVFGPSIPTLMGLRNAPYPETTAEGAILPLINHGIPCMSMGFLLPKSTPASSNKDVTSVEDGSDTPIVWRGLMVQKAVQQLLFDVYWAPRGLSGPGLDVLVVDMPPGTGDVQLTFGQLVKVDGAVIVSTPQDVALSDVRKGVSMFRKVNVPITGIVLNQSRFFCPGCSTPHYIYGSAEKFRATAKRTGVKILGELPIVSGVSIAGDKGVTYGLYDGQGTDGPEGKEWISEMDKIARSVWEQVKAGTPV